MYPQGCGGSSPFFGTISSDDSHPRFLRPAAVLTIVPLSKKTDEKNPHFAHNRAQRRLGEFLEISQQDFNLLLEQVRELTSRVHRLEGLLRVAPAEPAAPLMKAEPLQPPVISQPEISAASSVPLSAQTSTAPPHSEPTPLWPSAAANSDLESRIGSHWLNRIGIAAVLIGVSYFLKLAFDNGWIGPTGRIAIGLISGIAVMLWSERFRTRGYNVFSYSLKAVGIGVLYLSLWAAFQVYHLMPSGVVFACMLVVTAATCAMAITQDAEILAVFAITGGFSTPVLLSTGVNREIALFSYVLLLDLGILALVAFKPWRRLLWLGFAGTLALYIGWYGEFYNRSQFELTLTFATLFFAVFAAAPLFMLRQEHGEGTIPLLFALANGATYFFQAYAMINEISSTAMAWFSLALALVYLQLNRMRRKSADSAAEHNLKMMHLALAIGLITVAIPIRLEAHWITIGWFVEAGVLLWVADRIKSDLLGVFALTAIVLGTGRLLFLDNFVSTQLVFNMRMAVFAVAVAVLAFAAYLASKREDENAKIIAAVALIAMNALALIALSREVADYYSQEISATLPAPGAWRAQHWTEIRSIEIARDFTYSALYMGYGAMLMIVGFWRSSAFVRWQGLVLIAATTAKVFIYDTSQLDRVYRILSFIVLGVLLLAVSFAYQRDWLKLSSPKTPEVGA